MRFTNFTVLSLLASLPCKAVSSREEDDIAMKSRHLKPKKGKGGTKEAKENKGKGKGGTKEAKENKGKGKGGTKEAKENKGKVKGGTKEAKENKGKEVKGKKGKKSSSPSLVPSTLPSCVDPISCALEALYDSTNGSGWTPKESHNWGDLATIDDVCDLTRVTCTAGKITSLDLGGFRLDGSIPSEIGLLTNLEYLELGFELDGPIPTEIGLLTTLTFLDLDNNELTGPIPTEIGLLTSLTDLDLSDNQLTGPIPPEIGLLTSLTGLGLDENQLTGTLPSEFGNITPFSNCFLGGQTGVNPLVDDCGVKGNCDLQ